MEKFFIQKWKHKIQSSSFIKSVLTLSAGVVVSQLVSLIATPILSRIYDPHVLGDFSILTSNTTIIGTVITMGFLSAIMLPEDDDEAKGLCRLLAKLITGCSTVLLVVLVLTPKYQLFSVSIDYPLACIALWSIVLLDNLSSLCYSYVNRQKIYKVLFWNPSLGTISNTLVNIIMGMMGFGLWGYICSRVISSILVICHMLYHANPFVGKIQHRSIALMRQYRNFPLVLLPSNLIGTLSAQLPVLMLDKFWGSFALGNYSMCMNIMNLPKKFLAAPVNRVFYREATERINRGENIGEFAFSLVNTNVKLALIPVVLVIAFGEPIFVLILGDQWAIAGKMASVMSFYILLSFCTSCLSGKFVIIGKKTTILIMNIVVLCTNYITFIICNLLDFSAFTTVTIFSIIGCILSLIDLAIFMKQTNISIAKYVCFIVTHLLLPVAGAVLLRLAIQNLLFV